MLKESSLSSSENFSESKQFLAGKMSKLRKHTFCEKSTVPPIRVNRLRQVPLNDKSEFTKLTLRSLQIKFPISGLKPFSSFFSIQNIEKNIKNTQSRNTSFSSTAFRKKQTECLSKAQQDDRLKQSTRMSQWSSRKTFSKKNIAKSKALFIGNDSNKINFQSFFEAYRKVPSKCFGKNKRNSKTKKINQFMQSQIFHDDQSKMVSQFFKDHQINKNNRHSTIKTVNQKIMTQYPEHFETIPQSNQQTNQSRNCEIKIFNLKKQNPYQHADETERFNTCSSDYINPETCKVKVKKSKHLERHNNSFCLYSKSKNKIFEIKKDFPVFRFFENSNSDSERSGHDLNLQSIKLSRNQSIYSKYKRNARLHQKYAFKKP